jgi:hypothetical protein
VRRWLAGGSAAILAVVLGPRLGEDDVDALPVTTLRQVVSLADLDGWFLPAATRPVEVAPAGLATDADGVLVPADRARPDSYTVVSSVPIIESAAVQSAAPVPGDPGAIPDPPEAIRRTALDVTGDQRSAYSKLVALRNFFRDPASGFVYDNGEDAPTGISYNAIENPEYDANCCSARDRGRWSPWPRPARGRVPSAARAGWVRTPPTEFLELCPGVGLVGGDRVGAGRLDPGAGEIADHHPRPVAEVGRHHCKGAGELLGGALARLERGRSSPLPATAVWQRGSPEVRPRPVCWR